jgi:hypothetical protein
MTTLRDAAQQALEYMKSVGQMDMCPEEWAIVERLEAAMAEPVEPTSIPTFPPVSQWKQGCAVCGIGADGKAYGYVCPRLDCPIKITCGGAV